MTFKDIFNFSYFRNKIKLDKTENEIHAESEFEVKLNYEDDPDIELNEWHQEYELIYQSYILEK